MTVKLNRPTKANQPKAKTSKINTSKEKQTHKTLRESAEFIRNTLDNMLEGCQILGFDWRYLYLNAVAEIHNHRPNQELLGNTYMEMWPGIESTYIFTEIKRCMDERIVIHLENRFVYADRSVGWFNLSIQPVPEGIIIFSQDITERKQAEQEIVRLASFPTRNPNPVVEIDTTGAVCYMNPAAQKLFPDLASRGFKHPWLTGLEDAIIRLTAEGVGQLQREVQVDDQWYSQPIYYVPEAGRLRVYGTEITERKLAERKTAQLKRLYATLSQVNQMIVRVKERQELFQTICDVAVGFGEFSLAWVGLVDEGSGKVQPVAANGLDVNEWPFPILNIHEDGYKDSLNSIAIRTSKVVISEDIQADGRMKSFNSFLQPYSYHAAAVIPFRLRGKTIGTLSLISHDIGLFKDAEEVHLLDEMGLDISFALDNIESEEERKKAEEARAQLAAIVESSDDAIIGKTLTGIITSWNKGAEKVYGYAAAEIVGRPVSVLIPPNLPDELPTILNQLKVGEGINHYETIRRRKDGRQIHVSLTISPIRNTVGELIGASTIARDISERKQAQERVRESEERFRLLFENNHTVMMLIDPVSGAIRNANRAAAKFYGYALPELQAMNINDINILTSTEIYEERMRALREERSYFNFQHRLSSGEVRFVEVNSSPLEVDGNTLLFSIIHDITERKLAEDALRESEALYRLAIETAGAVPYREVYRDEGKSRVQYEFIGEGIRQIIGFGPEEFTAELWEELTLEMHPLGVLAGYSLEEAIERVRSGLDSIWTCDFKIRARDGTIRWVFEAAVELRDEHGISHGSIGLYQDITQRKQAEEALKRNEHVLRLFVEHSPASIAMLDRDMKYIVFSHRYLIDYGLGEQDLTGRSHYEVFPEIPERWKEIHRRCLSGAVEKTEEDPFIRVDGRTDWVRWEVRPWYEGEGKVGGLILFSEVITERKLVQDELRILNLELEQRVVERTMELSQANRAKDEFLANMSHELRTPLNTVLGLSESLLEQRRGALNEKQVQSIELIASSGQHLLNLINDILEVSKIEAGKLQLRPTSVSVKELCESSLNFIEESALKKLISVKFNQDRSISMFNADPQRVKQILINLLTNAVKFTPERGSVTLDVNTNDERDQILFSITDTGIGIAREDLKKLFTPFMQLDSGLSRQYEGTGLGLALVHKLTELHGGSVLVESEAGKGSRFTIALPLSQDLQEQTSSTSTAEPAKDEQDAVLLSTHPKERGAILVADDNEINSEMLVDYLEGRGYRVLAAWNGEDALEKAVEFAPAIILMDIQMPKMDGLEATRRLRANPRFISTPIVALTALVMPGDKERCLAAGANEYLSKPVNLKMLLKLIERLIQTTS